MNTIAKRKPRKSALRTSALPPLSESLPGNVPTLAQMVRDGQASAARIRRATQEALIEWFAQSERLNIARTHYRLRGERFIDFARRISVDRASAFELVKLHRHRSEIMSRCLDEQKRARARGDQYAFPGWRAALERNDGKSHHHPRMVIWGHGSDEWQAPQALFVFLDRFFRFDWDACATPQTAKCRKFWTKGADGLKQVWEPGKVYWMNAPYSQAGKWARKAAEAAKGGAIVVGLFANRSSTAWYRDYVVPLAMVVQLRGRLSFVHQGRVVTPGGMSEAPFPSILAIWPRDAGARLMPHCTPISAMLLEIPG